MHIKSPLVAFGIVLVLLSQASALYPEDSNILTELYKFYKAYSPSYVLGWSIPPTCSWTGVTCDGSNDRVTGLNLPIMESDFNPYTPFPEMVSRFPRLNYLGLRWVQDDIPESYRNLTRLEYLTVYSKMVNGTLPTWILGLPSLKKVSLDGRWYGSIPTAGLPIAQKLETLSLARNLEGELPGEFCLYPKLTTLDVQGNHLEGCIPSCYREKVNNGFKLSYKNNDGLDWCL